MWGDHVFICVFHWRPVCRDDGKQNKKNKKIEHESKYQVTCVTEGCFCNS